MQRQNSKKIIDFILADSMQDNADIVSSKNVSRIISDVEVIAKENLSSEKSFYLPKVSRNLNFKTAVALNEEKREIVGNFKFFILFSQ